MGGAKWNTGLHGGSLHVLVSNQTLELLQSGTMKPTCRRIVPKVRYAALSRESVAHDSPWSNGNFVNIVEQMLFNRFDHVLWHIQVS